MCTLCPMPGNLSFCAHEICHKSYSLEQSLVFHFYLGFPPCLVGVDFPQSPLQIYDDLMSLYRCAPAISFVCLLVSSWARQMSTAFCRSSFFSRRSSSCILSVPENTILSHNILSFISPKLHKFARDLKSVRNESKGSWYVMFIVLDLQKMWPRFPDTAIDPLSLTRPLGQLHLCVVLP